MKSNAWMALLAGSVIGTALALNSQAALAQKSGGAAGAATSEAKQFELGRQLYDTNCTKCHQAGGVGVPPNLPALAGNGHLKDLRLIVSNIHLGKGGMLAFPNLTAEELAALVTYIRNAWSNRFGAVSVNQVKTILAGLTQGSATKVSVWTGVYTKAQDKRGEEVHAGACATCHGERLNGAGQPDMPPAPAIARASFLHKWKGQTVAALFNYVRTKMPSDSPGTLSDQQYIDSIAHMFAVSQIPAGNNELPPDPKALADIVIDAQPH